MDELREIALADHTASDEEARELAAEFFRAMDPELKGYVRFEDFAQYMRLVGRAQMGSPEFFGELTSSENLGADEVLTVYYIFKSGRPFCDGFCGRFIKGNYFTCLKCLETQGSSAFNVCPRCVVTATCLHGFDHKDFVDPFVLLHRRKMEHFQNRPIEPMPTAPSFMESLYNIADSGSTRTAFLDETRPPQRMPTHVGDRLATLVQLSLSLGNFLAAIGACTIM